MTIHKLDVTLPAVSVFVVSVGPYLKIQDFSLAFTWPHPFCVTNKMQSCCVLWQAFNKNFFPLRGKMPSCWEAVDDVPKALVINNSFQSLNPTMANDQYRSR